MIQKLSIFLFLQLLWIPLYGQSILKDTTLAITYSPSAIVNVFSGIQFGVEKNIGFNNKKTFERFLEFEAAYIPRQDQFIPEGRSEKYKEGFRFKLAYKVVNKANLVFLTTIYVRSSFHTHIGDVIREGGYLENMKYRKSKTLIGPTFGLGYSEYFNSRWGIEMAANAGFGMYMVRFHDFPEDGIERWQPIWGYNNDRNYLYLILGLSIKVKYRLGSF